MEKQRSDESRRIDEMYDALDKECDRINQQVRDGLLTVDEGGEAIAAAIERSRKATR